jgi:hypothetical protein
MQACNTLNYAVQQQKNKRALTICFSFTRVLNTLTNSYIVTQRIAHAIVTTQHTATLAQIAQIVAQQQQLNNAASVCNYTNSATCKLLHKNTVAAQQQVCNYM